MRRLLLALALVVPAAARAAGPAPTNWPQFRGNWQHTSTAPATANLRPRVLWSRTLPSSSDYGPTQWYRTQKNSPSIGPDGTIYATGYSKLWAINPDGSVKWQTPEYSGPVSQPAITDDGKVIFSSQSSVVAMSTDTGSVLWQTNPLGEAGGWYGGGPLTIGPDGTLFGGDYSDAHIGNSGAGLANVYAISPSTGGVLWRSVVGAGMQATGMTSLSSDGGTVYYTLQHTPNVTFVAVGSSGNLIRSQTRVDGYASSAMSVDGDGYAYTYYTGDVSGDVYLIKVNLVSGTTAWQSTLVNLTAGEVPFGPTVGPTYVYGADDNGLVAYDKATGNKAWTVNYQPKASPVLVGGTTLYYIAQASNQGRPGLYNVDPLTGAVRWVVIYDVVNTFSPGAEHGIAVSTSGAVYVLHNGGSNYRTLYAIGDSGASTISISTTGPSVLIGATTSYVSTVTVRLSDAVSSPIDGAIVKVGVDQLNGATLALSTGTIPWSGEEPWQVLTTTSGEVKLRHTVDLGALPPVQYENFSSTIAIQLPGQGTYYALIQDVLASTFTVSVTTGAIEDTGMIFRVSTVTITVTGPSGSRVPNHPVSLSPIDYPVVACGSLISPSDSFILTNSTGQAQFVIRLPFALGQVQSQCVQSSQYQAFKARWTAYVLGLPPVTFDTKETRVSTFTVSLSTPVIQSDVRQSTITVTLYDVGGSTLPNVPVALNNFTQFGSSGPFRVFFKNYYETGVASANDDLVGYTDSFGQATFLVTQEFISGGAEFDMFGDFSASFPVIPLNAAPSTAAITVESNELDGYMVTAATTVAVGIAFRSTVTAVNKHGHKLPEYNEPGVNLVPLFNGTAVQGTGALGTNQITFLNSGGEVVISSQTYNKIENIQIKAVRANQTKTGLSNGIDITGPARFVITMPPAATAGQVFIATISAVDVAGSTVVGYTGTLSLTSLLASNTAQLGTGQLSVTNVNMPANGWVTITNQSYNKGETIKLRAYDSALGIEGVSSTSIAVSLPALTVSHYRVSVPTQVTVGVPFRAQFVALDASSNPVTYALSRSLNIQALLSLSPEISGTGSLGTSASSLAAGTNNTLITNQTYNKIQTVYIKVTDEDGRVGISTNAVVFSGPTQFDVTIATYAQAGVQFQMIVTARDGGGQQVLGYDGTVSVAAVQSGNTSLSGAGILGVTSLNVAGGLGVSSFQTYTKAEGIRLRVSDSAINVTSYSSSMTVRAGPAASMTVGANPQSTVASVPSVLTTTVLDQYSNAVQGATVTYSVVSGSGVLSLSLSGGAVVSAVTTTNSVTNASGQAEAFFGSTNTLSSQANLLRVTLGSLLSDTTIYNAVLITSAGGTIVNLADPRIRVDCPANAWSFSIRMSAQSRAELSAADLALTTAAFAAQSNVFVSTVVAKLTAVRDSNPNLSAGNSPTKVNLSLPVEVDVSSQVTVGSYRGQSILVPLSVLRIFKLNQATSLFEMVLDGTNLADLSSRTVTAQLADPNGIYAIGAPPFTTLSAGSSGTVTAVLAAGATATVDVPFGAFSAATNLQVGVPSAASVPALPTSRGITGTGLTISIQTTNSLQPSRPVTVNIGYRAQDVLGLNPDHLRLARYDEATGWVVLDSSVDTIARRVSGDTDHFSLFQVVAVAPHADLSSGIVFPNPFRPNAGHTTLKFGQLPALAKIKIFTVSGRKLKDLETDATGQVLSWDAKDKDGNILPSGVYLALIESGKSRKTLKFAIQR